MFSPVQKKNDLINRKITINKKDMSAIKKNECCPAEQQDLDLRPVEGTAADVELVAFTKALGHPVRIQILRLLTRTETCICRDIVEEIQLAQSTVSQHLKVLKEAGLIRGNIEGTSTCYCIDSKGLRRLKVLMAGL